MESYSLYFREFSKKKPFVDEKTQQLVFPLPDVKPLDFDSEEMARLVAVGKDLEYLYDKEVKFKLIRT